jgi:predicted transcriptional regulator
MSEKKKFFRIDTDINDKLQKYCDKTTVNQAKVINLALEKYLKSITKEE